MEVFLMFVRWRSFLHNFVNFVGVCLVNFLSRCRSLHFFVILCSDMQHLRRRRRKTFSKSYYLFKLLTFFIRWQCNQSIWIIFFFCLLLLLPDSIFLLCVQSIPYIYIMMRVRNSVSFFCVCIVVLQRSITFVLSSHRSIDLRFFTCSQIEKCNSFYMMRKNCRNTGGISFPLFFVHLHNSTSIETQNTKMKWKSKSGAKIFLIFFGVRLVCLCVFGWYINS